MSAASLTHATGWHLASTEPDATPATSDWIPIPAARTVNALLCEGELDVLPRQAVNQPGERDWWYRLDLPEERPDQAVLRLANLATLFDVWFDDQPVFSGSNSFITDYLPVPASARQLTLRFRSLASVLSTRKPRPQWKTGLVNNNLRWYRTSLLGHTVWSGWQWAIGPCQPLEWLNETQAWLDQWSLCPRVQGDDCQVSARPPEDTAFTPHGQQLTLQLGDAAPVTLSCDGETLSFGDLPRWQVHSQGTPHRHPVTLALWEGDRCLAERRVQLGFRELTVSLSEQAPSFHINQQRLFMRGACWSHSNLAGFEFDADKARRILTAARDAGMTMLRIGGTMQYEADAFYDLCDELGVLVWQDAAFANMDYPHDDPDWLASASAELHQQARRLSQYAAVVAWCGNSEVEQQAAMLGQPRERWRNPWFAEHLPALLRDANPDWPYWPSTPCDGALPFHTDTGLAHYFGLGAYRRDEQDLQLSQVRFTPECLGHSHLPDDTFTARHFGATPPLTHTPAWKAGVPRDAGCGWDFEDIRDHYLRQYFHCDPVQLRSADPAGYAQRSRLLTGYLLSQAFHLWRSDASPCQGALVWWLNDLVPGAGWGLFDSDGGAKPALHGVATAWQAVQVSLVPQGLNGHSLSCINESPAAIDARVTVTLLHTGRGNTLEHEQEVTLAPYSNTLTSLDSVLGGFQDTTASYHFGAEPWDVIAVSLCGENDVLLSQHCHFPTGLNLPVEYDRDRLGLSCDITHEGDDVWLILRAERFVYFAEFTLTGWQAERQGLHLLPGQVQRVRLIPDAPGQTRLRGHLSALNLASTVRLAAEVDAL